jgi:hypothetical protein
VPELGLVEHDQQQAEAEQRVEQGLQQQERRVAGAPRAGEGNRA